MLYNAQHFYLLEKYIIQQNVPKVCMMDKGIAELKGVVSI